MPARALVYERRRPEATTLYQVVQDNLATLYGAVDDGAIPVALPSFVRRELEGYLNCALLCRRTLCASLDGFTLHGATRAGGLDEPGREALLKYILRPAVAQERITQGPDGLIRIMLKKPFSDGTVAVDMDPLSLLSRLPRRSLRRVSPPSGLTKRVTPCATLA